MASWLKRLPNNTTTKRHTSSLPTVTSPELVRTAITNTLTATSVKPAVLRSVLLILSTPNPPLVETHLSWKKPNTGIFLWMSMMHGWESGFCKDTKLTGARRFTDSVNLGLNKVCNLAPSPATFHGAWKYRWKKQKEKCYTSGSMLQLVIYQQLKSGQKSITPIGSLGGRTIVPNWSTSSGKTTSFSTASFSRVCWKPMVDISCRITCPPMSSWISKATKFPLPAIGRCGRTNIMRNFLANRMFCAIHWHPSRQKPRMRISPGLISKPRTTTSCSLFSATLSTERWFCHTSITAESYRNAAN